MRTISVASDAGSVTGSFTGSLGGASVATGEGVFAGKRSRKRKAEKDKEDVASARGGALGGSTRPGSVDMDSGSVRGGGTTGGPGADDADEDDELDDDAALLGGEDGPTDTEAEKKNLALLVDAFNPIQSARYDMFKRAKLKKETLRRIVNHALSQSVPASVVTTVNGFTKVFAGEIVEKARTVQAEWAEAHDMEALAAFEAEEAASETTTTEIINPPTVKPTPSEAMSAVENGVHRESSEGIGSSSTLTAPPHVTQTVLSTMQRDTHTLNGPASQTTLKTSAPLHSMKPKREFKPPPNPHRGQLLPSHLREALRRYKRDGEGGGVGTSGLSLQNLGIRGTFTCGIGSGGQRLFR